MVPQILRLTAAAILLLGAVARPKRRAPVIGAAVLLLIGVLACRSAATRFIPLTSPQDVLVCLAAVVLVAYWALSRRGETMWSASGVYVAAALMLVLGAALPAPASAHENLRSLMLPVHVGGAILAYGLLTLHLVLTIQAALRAPAGETSRTPAPAHRERLAGRLAVAGEIAYGVFVLGMGMIWGKLAWGRYWGWDLKETLSLITFGAYALYLYFELVIRPSSAWLRVVLSAGAYVCLLITFFLGARFSALHGYG